MNRKLLLTYLIFCIQFVVRTQAQTLTTQNSNYVNVFMGTAQINTHSLPGNTFPGATTPFGMVQLSPETHENPETYASGYNYADSTIVGFSHTHLSGTGVADLFDVLVMPGVGKLRNDTAKNLSNISGFYSKFSHKTESAKPGYYQVKLLDYNINAELTATEHAGMHRYTFPKSNEAHVLIDMNYTFSKTRTWTPLRINAQIKVINNHTIEGYRIISGWVYGYRKVYFRAEFSKPFEANTMISGTKRYFNQPITSGWEEKILLDFTTNANEEILVKVGISATSVENARLNLSTEIPNWDFNQVANNTLSKWDKELGCIAVEGTTEQKQIFYSCLYHTFIQPNNIADVSGDYQGEDMGSHTSADKQHYSTLSLWDTYRSTHPLYTLVQTKRTASIINSMLRQYNAFGFLPLWQLWGLENFCMIGNHAIPVIVDAALKGIEGFDLEKAYEAVKMSSINNHAGSPFNIWEKYNFYPEDLQTQSVSLTLETAYDDWCVAQFAKKLGKTDDYNHFMKRSENYKNLFDTKTKFFRGKNSDGKWIEPFNPLEYGYNGGSPFTEGNAWQYLFYVPQHVKGLAQLFGGEKAFSQKLDTFYTLEVTASAINANASGFIGQYAHGNEPSHHIAYLYNYTGEAWKSQKMLNRVITEMYNSGPAGYSGNEDCGQMSSWYIFSAMGFYPVNPANGIYVFGAPVLKSATINLENGNSFTMNAPNVSKQNIYIQEVKLNNKLYTKTYISHADIVKGGKLEFVMGNKPNNKYGANSNDWPVE